MFKSFIEENGKSLVFWMKDVMAESEINDLPISERCKSLIAKSYRNDSFTNFTEDDCQYFLADFVEPVAFGDIKLTKIDLMYRSIMDACQSLWDKLSLDSKSLIRKYASSN